MMVFAFENYFWLEGPLPCDQGRRITVTHQNQPMQCSNCFGYSIAKYGNEMNLCPGNGNGRACKALNTERAKMAPYMKVLEKLLGYKSLKAKFGRMGHMEEVVVDEDDSEITFKTTYKSPIVEKDEQIVMLEKEKECLRLETEKLKTELPNLKENLTKTKSHLSAVQKTVKQKSKQINQASTITEKCLAEAINLDPSYLKHDPHLVTLLAIFQDRDDFEVDTENQVIKPVHEDTFIQETVKNVTEFANEQDDSVQGLCMKRLGDAKNLLLESVKQRWIPPGRRDSISSNISGVSKRDRDEDITDRSNRLRTVSPIHS